MLALQGYYDGNMVRTLEKIHAKKNQKLIIISERDIGSICRSQLTRERTICLGKGGDRKAW